jgi:hypothetical protein
VVRRLRLSPLEETLLLCIQAERSPAAQARLAALLADRAVAWTALRAEAARQAVLPLVAQALSDPRQASAVPEATRQDARRERLQTLFANTVLHTELRRLGALLAARGIPVTPLKGTHLTERLYGGLDARWCGDIDLLVPEADLMPTDAFLRAEGYAPASAPPPGLADHPFHGVPLVRQHAGTTTVVELHWNLTDPRFVAVDYRALWARIPAAGGRDSGLRPLPAEELLVFLSIHLPKHHNGVLRLLADIDRLVRRETRALDWERLTALARGWDADGLLYFALRRAQHLFDTPLPPAVTRALRPVPWCRAAVGLLAGSRAVIRPPAGENLRYNRSRLAYAAMLSPAGRAFRAYRHYLFPPARSSGPVALAGRVARGVAWTGITVASAVLPWPRAGVEG